MKPFFQTILLAAIGTGIVLMANLLAPTYLNGHVPFFAGSDAGLVDGNLIIEVVKYHRTHPVFGLRQFVTYPVLFISNHTALPLGAAFILVQAVYLWGAITLLLLLGRMLTKTKGIRAELYTLFAFVASHSVLFAFATPIYTYDDFLQYLLLFAAWVVGIRKRWVLYIVCITLALLVRESTLLVLPAFGLLFVPELLTRTMGTLKKRATWLRLVVVGIVPTLLYSACMYLISLRSSFVADTIAYTSTERFDHLLFNFQNSIFGIESIVGFFLVFALPLYMLYRFRSVVPAPARAAFFLTLLINTPIAYIATRVQEVRILALPLLFIWPYAGALVATYVTSFRADVRSLRERIGQVSPAALLEVVSIGTLTFLLAYTIYTVLYLPTHTVAFHAGYQVYGVASAAIIILSEMLRALSAKTSV